MPERDPTDGGHQDPSQPAPPPPSRRARLRRWRRSFFGEPAATAFYGAAEVGPGRNATKEEWEQFREQMRNPAKPGPSVAPPGYKFVWYTDSGGMRHRSLIKDPDRPAPPADGGAGTAP